MDLLKDVKTSRIRSERSPLAFFKAKKRRDLQVAPLHFLADLFR